MANIKLGNRPKTFKPVTLKVELPDGTTGSVPLTFKYFTKTESGKLFDDMLAAAKESDASAAAVEDAGDKPADKPVEFSLEAVMSKTRDQNAAYLLRVIDSWGLDMPLSLESLQQMDDEMPAVSIKIMENFRSAAQQGKLGN